MEENIKKPEQDRKMAIRVLLLLILICVVFFWLIKNRAGVPTTENLSEISVENSTSDTKNNALLPSEANDFNLDGKGPRESDIFN